MPSNKKRAQTSRKKILIVLTGVLIVCLLVFGLSAAHVITLPWQDNTTSEANTSDTDGNTTNSGTNKTTNQSTDSNNGDKTVTSGNDTGEAPLSNVAIKKPFGTFVSNHTPGQNGAPNTINSVCNTSAGVMCTITFTKGSVSKSLATKRTSRDGTAYWNNWTPASIGLTSGSWSIKAVAQSGNKSATTTDSINLEVQ